MNTNFKVIGLTRLGIKPESTAQETDALYHSTISKRWKQLVDPNSNNNASVCGYEKLASKINNFVKAGLMFPKKVKVSSDDLTGNYVIATNLRNKKAKWHKYCFIEFSALRFSKSLS